MCHMPKSRGNGGVGKLLGMHDVVPNSRGGQQGKNRRRKVRPEESWETENQGKSLFL